MKRSKHSLSHYQLATFDMGNLIPVGNFEVLPGDSIRMSTSALLRLSPLMTPVMHPISVRIHHWFIPYRLVWDGWEDFITGGADGEGEGQTIPVHTAFDLAQPGQLGDYLGIPPPPDGSIQVSALPFRAYNHVWNEYYRDQDLEAERTDSSFNLQAIAWEKDIFTAARPWTQKGPEVTLPLGTSAPVRGIGLGEYPGTPAPFLADGQDHFESGGQHGVYADAWPFDDTNFAFIEEDPDNPGHPRIRADLTAAGSVAVNDVRLAFALQRYKEARAQYGSRYTEYLRYLGVSSSDARLQRPEYLGGGKATVSFSEVLKTGEGDVPSDDAPVGEMRGHGISALRTRTWTRYFEEHGIVLALASVRPRTIYSDGLHRQWSRVVKEDFWQKELEQIGQQEVYNREVRIAHGSPNGVFGYNDRYYEYRHQPSIVTGEFRTTLNDWHLARQFASDPALNASFIKCVPSKRIFAEQTQHSLWGMFSHSIKARRLVGNRTIGRIF